MASLLIIPQPHSSPSTRTFELSRLFPSPRNLTYHLPPPPDPRRRDPGERRPRVLVRLRVQPGRGSPHLGGAGAVQAAAPPRRHQHAAGAAADRGGC